MSLKQGLPTVAIVPQEPLLTLDAFSIFLLLIFLLFFILFYKISIILAASKPKEDSSSTEEVKDSEAFYGLVNAIGDCCSCRVQLFCCLKHAYIEKV